MLVECLGPHCGGQKFDSWDPRYNRICTACKTAMQKTVTGGLDEVAYEDRFLCRPAKTRRQADRDRLLADASEAREYGKALDKRYGLTGGA